MRFVGEDEFPAIIGLAFAEATKLGTLVCKLTLLYLDKFDAILEERFRAMEKERRKWSAMAYRRAKGRPPKPGPRAK